MKRKNRRRGSAAVLLCVMLFSVITSVCVIFEAADRKTAVSVSESGFELAGRNVLSCYDRELQKRYGLFGYELPQETVETILKRSASDSLMETGFGTCRVESVKVEKTAYSLSDPESMMIQIRQIAKASAVPDIIRTAKEDLHSVGENVKNKKKISERTVNAENHSVEAARQKENAVQQNNAAQGGASEAEGTKKEESEEDTYKKVKKNILKNKNMYSRDPESDGTGKVLSNQRILESLPSVAAGYGSASAFAGGTVLRDITDDGAGDATKDALSLVSYIDDHFQCKYNRMPDGDEGRFFDNEREYILFGKPEDEKNYKKAWRAIFAMREATNIAYLYADSGKRTEILELVSSLVPPIFILPADLLATAAWAALESYNDMKNLVNGNGVPLAKNTETWMTDIDGIINYNGSSYIAIPGDSPMRYDRYLDMLLFTVSNKTKVYRIMDLIQINMKGAVRSDFVLADHFTGFSMKAEIRKGSHARSVPGSSATVRMTHTYWSKEQ